MGFLTLINKLTKSKESNNTFESIPKEIIDLLWFKDGPYQNYKEAKPQEIELDGFIFSISTSFDSEPSLISVKDTINKPNNMNIDQPGYYPSYSSLNPNQRWIYLNWLKNIDDEIDISYVFIFYYGLERHLFSGDYAKAWNVINRLRKYHKNNSFRSYSTSALIASCIVHNRPDLFVDLLENTKDIEDIEISDLYLMAKYKLKGDITAKEIMKLARNVGFKNNRYLKDDALVFENELINIMRSKYSSDTIKLSNFNLNKSPKKEIIIIANMSFSSDKRCIKIPALSENKEFKELMYNLLVEAHEQTKLKLKELRKSGSYMPVVNKKEVVRKTPDKIYNKSTLFDKIDTNLFDKNEEYYNNYICPYCFEKTSKMPVSKGKCSNCKNDILVKNSIFTGVKIALTKDEYKNMTEIKDERVHRNHINSLVINYGLDQYKIKKIMSKENIAIEESIIILINEEAKRNKSNGDLGLYRNNLMSIGKLYEELKNYEDALNMYLAICYYDLNGASNSGLGFAKYDVFLAPAIIDWIKKICLKLGYNEEIINDKFKKIILDYNEKGMFMKDNIAWKCMYNALYKDILVRGSYEEILEQILN